MLWKSSENQVGRPNKRSTKFLNFFLKIRPFEKILDPPLFLPITNLSKKLSPDFFLKRPFQTFFASTCVYSIFFASCCVYSKIVGLVVLSRFFLSVSNFTCSCKCKCCSIEFQLENFQLKVFNFLNCFLAPLVSAQKRLALFPLRKFRYVANLIFKYLASIHKVKFYRDLRQF